MNTLVFDKTNPDSFSRAGGGCPMCIVCGRETGHVYACVRDTETSRKSTVSMCNSCKLKFKDGDLLKKAL